MIVLDTHAWLWWVAAPDRLSERARRAIDEADRVGVSTMSAWEVAMLVARGRIGLDRGVEAWVTRALAGPCTVAVVPDAAIAVAAGSLDREAFPGDPVDRIIYATARAGGGPLVTRDAAIRRFDPRLTVW